MDTFPPIDIIFFAGTLGFIPALAWLWFWMREDEHPEPWQYIVLAFAAGMVSVFAVIPFQKSILPLINHYPILILVLLAGIEEIAKFGGAYLAALKSPVNDEPIDPVIYLMAAAIGFAATENSFYIITSLSGTEATLIDGAIVGQLRFIGATLLHIVSSAIVGVFLAFSFYKSTFKKVLYGLIGLFLATLLHSAFNIGIVAPDINSEHAFLMLWFVAILLIAILEPIKKL